jgi:hypothetical protein
MVRHAWLYAAVLATAGIVNIAAAQTEPVDPSASTTPTDAAASTAPADAEQLKVRVASVSGVAQVRDNPDSPWRRAEVGMELGAGAEVRTSARSKIVLTIQDDQQITVDRVSTVSVLEAYQNDQKTTTDLVMKYGRTDYAIETAGREHDATIHTPSATLSVRGTAFTAYDQPPFAPQVETARGRVDFRYGKRTTSVARGGKAKGSEGPVDTALGSTVVDPGGALARTNSENIVIANEISRGAVLGFDQFQNIQTSFGGLGPQTDAQLISSLPGQLNFFIRWDQPGTDMNIAVLKLAGEPLEILGSFEPSEVLFPGFGLDSTITGGRIVVDNRGGPNGGQEVAFYNNAEHGIYGMQALHVSGPGAAVRFNAFLDGKPTILFATKVDADGNPIPNENGLGFQTEFATTLTRNIAPGGLDGVTALIPFPPELAPATDDGGARAASFTKSEKKQKVVTDKSRTARNADRTPTAAAKANAAPSAAPSGASAGKTGKTGVGRARNR